MFALKTLIIAGGKGTRLQHIAGEVPKPLVPVAGKPVLQYQLEMLDEQGFRDVIISINHLGTQIRDFVGNGSRFGLNVSYLEEQQPLGTAGGVKELESELTEDFLVLYGDVIMYMDLNKLVHFHQDKNADATLVVHPNDHPYDSDLLDCDNTSRVLTFHPKPHDDGKYYRNLVNAAVYVFSPKIFPYIQAGKKQDFGKDIFPKMVRELSVFAYNTTEYLKDMGTPDRLDSVAADIQSGKVKRKSYFYPQKAIFLDRDGVLNEDTDFIKTPDELQLFPFTAEAVKKINKSEYASIVVTNQSAVARNLCTEEGLRTIHNKMETELGKQRAKLDAIYYCPHHPDKGYEGENPFYKIECECRKPKPGMLLDAARDFHISLKDSYLIGDTDRDREAGKRAGCTTIGVRTGKASSDFKADADYMFENVWEAARFIVDDPLKEHFENVLELFHQYPSEDRPFIILVGGQARSGKSTLASYLRLNFQKMALSVLYIKVDDWIMPAAERTGNETVWERFRLDKFEKDIQHLFCHEPVKIQKYDSRSRSLKEETIYRFSHEDVVIMEGAPLLHSQSLLNLSDLAIFVEVDEEKRKERFQHFYAWKGIPDKEAKDLYEERLENEYEEIKNTAKAADIIIKN